MRFHANNIAHWSNKNGRPLYISLRPKMEKHKLITNAPKTGATGWSKGLQQKGFSFQFGLSGI